MNLTFVRRSLLATIAVAGVAIVASQSSTLAGKPTPPPPPPVLYRIQWLGSLGGGKTHVRDINAAGEAVGYSNAANGFQYAFVWTPSGGMVALETLTGGELNGWTALLRAEAMNDHGQIVGNGFHRDADGIVRQKGFLYTPGFTNSSGVWIPPTVEVVTPLAGDQQAVPAGINNNGEVCAESVATNSYREMVYHPGVGSVDLGATNGTDNLRSGINDAGQVVGTHIVGGTYYTYVSDPTSGLHLYKLIPNSTGYFGSWGTAINNAGTFVGGCNNPSSRSTGLVPYKDSVGGAAKLLTTLGGHAFGINNNGHIVGDRFLYTDSIGYWNLDKLIDPNDPQRSRWLSAWFLMAEDVSDAPSNGGFGKICGNATFTDSLGNITSDEAYVLTPVP